MGIRCDIIARFRNGTWRRIYAEDDGYCHLGVGEFLFDHYREVERVERLFTWLEIPEMPMRLRSTNVIGTSLPKVWPNAGWTMTEYTYVWDGETWWVGDPEELGPLFDLGKAIQMEAEGKRVFPFDWHGVELVG